MRRAGQFLTLFAVLASSFYLVALWRPFDGFMYRYLEGNARITSALLRILGVDAQASGLSIVSPVFSIAVRRGCDGIEPAWIFAAAVLAYPLPLRRKTAVLPAGVALILGANLVRILSLFLIGWRLPMLYPFAHLEFWPAAFMGLVIVMWLRWARQRPPRGMRTHGAA